jgi:hypothetical protein
MTLPPQTRDLAERLLAYENAAGKTSEPTEFAAFRVCETLRQPLCALAGVAGCRSLLSRALTLARAEAPMLSAVQVAADGSLRGLDALRPQVDADEAGEAGIIVITQLLGLLVRVVGEAMTLQLVTFEILPDFRSSRRAIYPSALKRSSTKSMISKASVRASRDWRSNIRPSQKR